MRLSGITWNHSRGYTSIVAVAQRLEELTQGRIAVDWDKRSLQAFADQPLAELTGAYDLMIIDHPWTGVAAGQGLLVPLDQHLSTDALADLRHHSVGASYESYSMNDHLWAIPLDAATPVASLRADLIDRAGVARPQTWDDLLALARKGLVAYPGIPQDTLMNFYMVCSTLGEDPCTTPEVVVERQTGTTALELLRELAVHLPPESFNWNPIDVYEAMTERDEIAYCPFAYGYVNYSIDGYARKPLDFVDTVALEPGGSRLRTTLGGTGLAVSSASRNREQAVQFAAYAAAASVQRGLFFRCGGQPGHRSAWTDARINAESRSFFASTLPALDRAFLRPRYDGHMAFQDNAGAPIRRYLMDGGSAEALLDELDRLYRDSRTASAHR